MRSKTETPWEKPGAFFVRELLRLKMCGQTWSFQENSYSNTSHTGSENECNQHFDRAGRSRGAALLACIDGKDRRGDGEFLLLRFDSIQSVLASYGTRARFSHSQRAGVLHSADDLSRGDHRTHRSAIAERNDCRGELPIPLDGEEHGSQRTRPEV